MAYATTAQLKQWLADTPGDMDPYEDALGELLSVATAMIERETGRVFGAPVEGQQLVEVGRDGYARVIDLSAADPYSVYADSDIELSGGTLAVEGTDYEVGPRNPRFGWKLQRYDWVQPLPGSAVDWSPGTLVLVIGSFGYANRQGVVPYCIRRACVLLAARLWERRQNLIAGALDATTGNHEYLTVEDPDYRRLIRPFIHPRKQGLV